MEIIPAVNAKSFEVVRDQALAAAQFAKWIHLDVTDGIFARNLTWGHPDELREIKNQISTPTPKGRGSDQSVGDTKSVEFEIHLMVANPEIRVEPWLRSGAKRVIVHVEAMANPPYILETAKQAGGEVMLALKPQTPVERLLIYAQDFKHFQILAVEPGLAGQKFQESVLGKIRTLRAKAPGVTIEVDGGIDLETSKLCKAAGADIVVAASYIFGSKDPRKAYEQLTQI